MINNLRTLFSAGLCASALLFSGCTSDDTSTGTDSSTSNPTATGSTGTDSTGTDTDSSTGTSMGETSTSTGGGGGGVCQLGCAEAVDCCPMGAMDCPGDYPNDWSCTDGVCEFGGCTADEQCTVGGALPDWKCLKGEVADFCGLPCEDDAPCEAFTLTCVGAAADGTKFCSTDAPAGCTKDEECGGFGVCNVDTGACECSDDGECTADGNYVCK